MRSSAPEASQAAAAARRVSRSAAPTFPGAGRVEPRRELALAGPLFHALTCENEPRRPCPQRNMAGTMTPGDPLRCPELGTMAQCLFSGMSSSSSRHAGPTHHSSEGAACQILISHLRAPASSSGRATSPGRTQGGRPTRMLRLHTRALRRGRCRSGPRSTEPPCRRPSRGTSGSTRRSQAGPAGVNFGGGRSSTASPRLS